VLEGLVADMMHSRHHCIYTQNVDQLTALSLNLNRAHCPLLAAIIHLDKAPSEVARISPIPAATPRFSILAREPIAPNISRTLYDTLVERRLLILCVV
jgi:hypothetical protein